MSVHKVKIFSQRRKGAKKTTKFFVRQPAEALRETKVVAQTLQTGIY